MVLIVLDVKNHRRNIISILSSKNEHVDYSEDTQSESGKEQSSSNGNKTKSKSKSNTYLISGAEMLMRKDKHRSDERRSEQTSSNDIKINEQLETYENEVFEEIADIERIVYRLMDKNKPEGEGRPIETVKTYTQKQNLKVMRLM